MIEDLCLIQKFSESNFSLQKGQQYHPSIPFTCLSPSPWVFPVLSSDSSGSLLQLQKRLAGFKDLTQASLAISTDLKEISELLYLSFVLEFFYFFFIRWFLEVASWFLLWLKAVGIHSLKVSSVTSIIGIKNA